MYPLLLVVLVIFMLYVLYWCMGWRVRMYLYRLPTYFQFPFLGSVHWLYGGADVEFNVLQSISEVTEKKNLPFLFWGGPLPVLLLSDPEDIKIVTNNFLEKPTQYNFAKSWVREGLVTAPANVWRHNIKLLGGTFNRTLVEGFQEIFNAQAQRLVDNFKGNVGELFDAGPYIMFNAFETIFQTALGIRVTDKSITESYYYALSSTLHLLTRRGFNIFYHPDWIYHLTSDYRELCKNVSIMDNISKIAIQKRRDEREALLNNDNCTKKSSELRGYLDILLDLSKTDPKITEEQILGEVNTIIFGGQETSANALSFVLLMVGSNPDVQSKLYIEMKTIFGDSKRNVETEDLKKMVYSEAVILETLRLFPPIAAVLRLADRDLKLKSCTIPKGVICCINIIGAGRSKRQWGPDAEQFIPERWLSPRIPSTAFVAFSSGRRACIGRRYALANIKTMLAYCIRELSFTSEAHQLKCKIDVALRPLSGHLLEVKLRN